MVWLGAILNKIKFFIIAITDTLKYLCCSRKQRRKLSTDFVPLSSVGVVSNDSSLMINTDDGQWLQEPYMISNATSQMKDVQEYINQYRQQKQSQMYNTSGEEVQPDFFQDMEPRIIKQKKLVIKHGEDSEVQNANSRLSFSPVNTLQKGSELASWEDMENTGNWDIDEENTEEMLKEKRRIEREKRLAENMKKRMEKDQKRMALKIS